MSIKNQSFILFSGCCFAFFFIFDFFQITNTAMISILLKYIVIWCAFLIAFPSPFSLPLFVTVICDYFLLFTTQYTLGVSLFCTVHLYYIILLSQKENKKRQQILLASLLPFGAILLPLYWMCFCYILCFLFHIKAAYAQKQNYPSVLHKAYLFALMLFALCDILTAEFQLSQDSFLVPFIWVCYAPSQILLAIVGVKLSSIGWLPEQISFYHLLHPQNTK